MRTFFTSLLVLAGFTMSLRADVDLSPTRAYTSSFFPSNNIYFAGYVGNAQPRAELVFNLDTNSLGPDTVLRYELFEDGTNNLVASGTLHLTEGNQVLPYSNVITVPAIWSDVEGSFRLSVDSGFARLTGWRAQVLSRRLPGAFGTALWFATTTFPADPGPASVRSSRLISVVVESGLKQSQQVDVTDDLDSGAWVVLTNTRPFVSPFTFLDPAPESGQRRFYRTSRAYQLPEIQYSFTTLRPAGVTESEEPLGAAMEFFVDPTTMAAGTVVRYSLFEGGAGSDPFAYGAIPLVPGEARYAVTGTGWRDREGAISLRFDSGSVAITNILLSVVMTNDLGQRVKYQEPAALSAKISVGPIYQQVTIEGTVRGQYAIEYANGPTGTNWSRLTTNSLPYSPYSFLDYSSSNQALRVYRAIGIRPD